MNMIGTPPFRQNSRDDLDELKNILGGIDFELLRLGGRAFPADNAATVNDLISQTRYARNLLSRVAQAIDVHA
jgi:hypothetical protein